MAFRVRAYKAVQMGNQPVNEVEAQRSGEDSGDGNEQTVFPTVFHGRNNQPQNSSRQHDTGGEGQNDVAESVR